MHDITRKLKETIKAELKRQDVEFSPVHHEAMIQLHQSPGLSQQILAEAMSRNKAQIARIVASLHHQKLIEKLTDEDDKRSVKLSLTAKGQQLLTRLDDVHRELMERMLYRFSGEEIVLFENFCVRAKDNLKAQSCNLTEREKPIG
jgi:DNA-binding MarR family transcriptional regulator